MSGVVSWWAFVLRYEARELWRSLPGPWWCKALLIAVCLAIPGPADELILVGLVGALRKRRARKEQRETA